MPTHYFYGQREYENVVLILRRHYLILLGIILTFLFFALLPIGAFVLLGRFVTLSSDIKDIIYFLVSVYYLFWIYGFFYALTDYILDVWIVTDHRIIDMK